MPVSRFKAHAPLLVYVTARDRISAEHLARAAVAQTLAACVNILPGMRSVYRWKGAIEEADEVVLVFKTTGCKVTALQQFIDAEHPYDMPCALVIEVADGLPGYLQWMAEETV